MSGREVVILVPGLFGFSEIGTIKYFDAVAKLLSRATGIQDIESLDTPPTGPLWRRVEALHKQVIKRRNEGAAKVHLVGHSTGGVDIRLLAAPRYLWPGGPSDQDRVSFFERLGALISISAPHKGTPIACRLRGGMEMMIPPLFFASVVAKYGSHDHGLFRRLVQAWGRTRLTLGLAAGEFLGERARRYLPGASEQTVAELHRFLEKIVEDHPLIHELTPYAMKQLNDRVASVPNEPAPPSSLSNFVTVAPPPGPHWDDFKIVDGLAPIRRLFYSLSYWETRLTPLEFGPLPQGTWIQEPKGLNGYVDTAQDGVVPAGSQSLDGKATRLVFGDHLDVVGHYPGREHGGATVFDSGAAFDDARMASLWNAVGEVISSACTARSRLSGGVGPQRPYAQ